VTATIVVDSRRVSASHAVAVSVAALLLSEAVRVRAALGRAREATDLRRICGRRRTVADFHIGSALSRPAADVAARAALSAGRRVKAEGVVGQRRTGVVDLRGAEVLLWDALRAATLVSATHGPRARLVDAVRVLGTGTVARLAGCVLVEGTLKLEQLDGRITVLYPHDADQSCEH